tara:strand:- start:531 stop:809 length:279 start_codon:yes stop_codon:yes gene_type:complete
MGLLSNSISTTAYRSKEESWRISRLNNVIEKLKLNKKIEVLNKIDNLHDHKGLLSVKWKNIPTKKDMSIIKKIWFSKIGDMSDTIEHLIINK